MKRKFNIALYSFSNALTLLSTLIIALLISSCSSEQQLIEQVEGENFEPLLFNPADRETTRRTTYIKFNIETFESLITDSNSLPSIELTIFPNERLTVLDSTVQKSNQGIYQWTGRIEAKQYGHLALTVSDKGMIGVVHQDKHVFEFLPGGNSITAVREIDPPKFPREYVPEDETAIIPEEALRDIEGRVEERPPFPQYPIKILILFPSNEFGLCFIDNIISNFDWSLLEDGFEHHIEDVFDHFDPTNITVDVDIACIDLPEEDVDTLEEKRDWLKDDAAIADLRDDHSADLVSLLVQDGDNCGIGMIPGLLAPRFETHAFSVVKMDCALAEYSLMHELGHNFKLGHDRFKTQGGLDYVCSNGFTILIDGVPEYRTPMAYYDYCGSLGLACPRVPTYSQDKVIRSDLLDIEMQLGISCDVLSEDINGSANNRQGLVKAAPYISNYR